MKTKIMPPLLKRRADFFKPMLYLGIDPGLRRTGVGVIDYDGSKFRLVGHSLIEPPVKSALPARLAALVNALTLEAARYNGLKSCAVENVFHSVNARSALILGQTRGACIAALAIAGFTVYEYSALQIKQSVTGYGRAEKEQVKRMVELQLGIALDKKAEEGKTPRRLPFDISDALACAICHAVSTYRDEVHKTHSPLL